MTAFKPHHLL